ncbi:hypothetical protein [Methylobacterium radiodurans]|uniref:hypothetical protein n=1 Tax=Methylobacterium radiodurans TaxID=2202828 RepID=UPI0013A54F42|nr:hypothetical protein [Methylobacterium radiodurans]
MDPTKEVVRFEEAFCGGSRAILGLAGLPPLLASWELLVRHGIAISGGAAVLAWLVSAGALAVGLPLLGVALMGFERTVTVDPREGTLSKHARGPFRLAWTRTQALTLVSEIGVEPEAWNDGLPTWCVVARFKDRAQPWRITRRADRDDALLVARDTASRLPVAY